MSWWSIGMPEHLEAAGETSKSHLRHLRESFYTRYARAPLIDIGSGPDPVFSWLPESADIVRYDRVVKPGVILGDAETMAEIAPRAFKTVWASHILEHCDDPVAAIRVWWRILDVGGHLVVFVPHRDLYERRTRLPSQWSHEHKHFYLPDRTDPPVTRSLLSDLCAAIPFVERQVVDMTVLNEGWRELPLDQHPCGEYSIRCVVQKRDEVEE